MVAWLGLIVSMVTPIVVIFLGVLLLRHIEGVKAMVTKQSGFSSKWADEFFDCCQQFLQALERELAILTVFSKIKDQKGTFSSECLEELQQLHIKLAELELRIRRNVLFAPSAAHEVTKAAGECFALTAELIDSKGGDVDMIISKMNEFNIASRSAHAEMLGLSKVEQTGR